MAYASVNSVYTYVKNVLNKDHRGMITPQRFNSFASQAQLETVDELISGYVEGTVLKDRYVSRQKGVFSKVDSAREGLRPLLRMSVTLTSSGGNNVFQYPDDYMISIGKNALTYNGKPVPQMDEGRYAITSNSYLGGATLRYPQAVLDYNQITLYPSDIDSSVTLSYYKIPQGSTVSGSPSQQQPTWAYNTVGNKPIYNSSNSINFELPKQLEKVIGNKILEMVGLSLREIEIYQAADREDEQATIRKDN